MNAREFYESNSSSKLKKIINIESKTTKQFYDSLIKIYQQNDINLILESHQEANFSKTLINKIYNSCNFTQISANQIYNGCSNQIKLYYNVKHDIPVYIFNFSFSKNSKFICNIFKSFHIKFSLQTGSLIQKYQNEQKIFYQQNKDVYGIFSNQKTCCLLILNLDLYNEMTIKHELFHYIQYILEKTKKITNKKFKFQDIQQLQLSKQNLEYLFGIYQFETHIKINLINQLEEMYYKFYNHLTKQQFIKKFINSIQLDPKSVITKYFNILLKLKNNDTTQLRLFAACYLIKNKTYLFHAITWLKEKFK